MLNIKNLYVSTKKRELLKGINLSIQAGEVHAIMGPNGAGKSTLGNILVGKSGYKVKQGQIIFNKKNLLNLNITERATSGLFLSVQHPIEIPGVSNTQFLKTAVNSIRKSKNKNKLETIDFMKNMYHNMDLLQIDKKYAKRCVNEGFSGGEKKNQ